LTTFFSRSGKKSYFLCRDSSCNVRVTVDHEEDLVTSYKGEHDHENYLVENLVKKKANEAIEKAMETGYSKPREVFGNFAKDLYDDPTTRSAVGKFHHLYPSQVCFYKNYFFLQGALPRSAALPEGCRRGERRIILM